MVVPTNAASGTGFRMRVFAVSSYSYSAQHTYFMMPPTMLLYGEIIKYIYMLSGTTLENNTYDEQSTPM